MKIIVVLNTIICTIKTITPTGVKTEQKGSSDEILVELSRLINEGFTILSASRESYTLINDKSESRWMFK